MVTRNQIFIQKAEQVRDAKGGFVKSWTNRFAFSIFAAIRHTNGMKRDSTSAGGEVAVAKAIIEMRYIAGVTAGDRVLHGSTAYRIEHVNNVDERNRTLILTCETGVAA